MEYPFYVKVFWDDTNADKIVNTELFTRANNFTEVAEQIENSFKEKLIGFNVCTVDSFANFIYVEDLEDYLKDARGLFKE